jgi:hypothetical protein
MELARIRAMLTIAPTGFGDETETAISRVAAITLKQLGSPVPAPVES